MMKQSNLASALLLLLMVMTLTSNTFVEKPSELSSSERFKGAWQFKEGGKETVKIISDNYFIFATYDVASKQFVEAGGGTWQLNEKEYKETYEFHTTDNSKVGKTELFAYKINNKALELNKKSWSKLEEKQQSPLVGTWRITERITPEGEKIALKKGPRKTLKLLSGERFQWAAFNTETKEFFGTGGGQYEAKAGKYTEEILFFSRDASRVGMKLTFDFEVSNGQWHHSGLGSTGNKVDEIWSRE